MKKFLLFFKILILSLVCSSGMSELKPSEDYKFSLSADDSDELQYRLYWKVLEKDEIQFEVHCRASGWVGFGLSPHGGMAGSDIAIGWVNSDGEAYLKDTHAVGNQAPIVDSVQNWHLIDASEQNGFTVLKMKRKLYTCDEQNDFDIKFETQRLIFAWSDYDPDNELLNWSYHGANRRIKSVVLLNFADETSGSLIDSEITDSFEYRLNNHLIPAKDTYYLCQMFKIPPLKTDLHLISYQVLIEKESLSFVHHFDVYMCKSSDFEKVKNISNMGYECGPGIDDEASSNILKGICEVRTMVFAWAVGGKRSISFPENTGFRFSKSDHETVMVINYHFDNPMIVKDHKDKSGLKFKFTKNLRKYDLGVLTVGIPTTQLDIVVPPRTESVKLSTICYPDCTEKFLPKEGITVFAGNLHTHLAGRALRTKLVRNGKIIKYLFDDQNYDFNYQSNILIQPTKLFPGDSLILECTYSSKNKDQFTVGGFGTKDEMCINFIYYYPKIDFQICSSIKLDEDLTHFYGKFESFVSLTGAEFENSIRNSSKLIEKHIKKLEVSQVLIEKFKNFYENSDFHNGFCMGDKNSSIVLLGKKKFLNPSKGFNENKNCRV